MKTLRSRLIFAHIIPWILVAPLLGLTLYRLLETQETLTQFSSLLKQEAVIIAKNAAEEPEIFVNNTHRTLFIESQSAKTDIGLTISDSNGQTLGSNLTISPAETEYPFSLLPRNNTSEHFYIRDNLAIAIVPVVDIRNHVLGLMTASKIVNNATAQLPSVRRWLLIAIVGELFLGIGIGIWLSNALRRDLQDLTEAIGKISEKHPLESLPERGPTEFRTLIKGYNTTIERLKKAEETRHHLLANIVHELSRPLGALQAAIQALQRGGDNDQDFRQELLAGMSAQINRLQPLLDNLTQLHGRIPGSLEITSHPTKLNEWLSTIIPPWQAEAQSKNLQWHTEISTTLPTLNIDSDRMAQAIGNLLSNAIKFTPAGGEILFSVQEKDTIIQISVRDTGLGIDIAEHDKIFDSFYRSNRETRFPQGMGLGLAITREIVNAHGGEVYVLSQIKQGSEFIIKLPI